MQQSATPRGARKEVMDPIVAEAKDAFAESKEKRERGAGDEAILEAAREAFDQASEAEAWRIARGPKRVPGRLLVAVSKGTPTTATSTPDCRSDAATSEPMKPIPTTTAFRPGAISARMRSQSATVRRS